MVMWARFLQFVPEDGISVRDLQNLLGLASKEMTVWLTRMGTWWGYVTVGPDLVIRLTPGGRKAIAVWRPLSGAIEERWEARFGRDAILQLRERLAVLAGQLDAGSADYLPILGYGLLSKAPGGASRTPGSGSLPALLSRVLLAFAVEFERESAVSLAICANVLRLAGDKPVRVRDLPRLAGVSKEAVATALSFLEKRGYAVRGKELTLTPHGLHARDVYFGQTQAIEERWTIRFGHETVHSLREWLELLASEPLFRGLEPYPDGWRASLPRPEALPHYPMVLHRGGFPDGS
jgi:Mn-dependent DtxR family transcriptional regulator